MVAVMSLASIAARSGTLAEVASTAGTGFP